LRFKQSVFLCNGLACVKFNRAKINTNKFDSSVHHKRKDKNEVIMYLFFKQLYTTIQRKSFSLSPKLDIILLKRNLSDFVIDKNQETNLTLKVLRVDLYRMKLCSVSHRQNHHLCFWKRRKFATKWYITICILDKSIVRI